MTRPKIRRDADVCRLGEDQVDVELVDAALRHAWFYRQEIRPDHELVEMKVKIPLELHIKLHGVRILIGQSISKSAEIALERYFQRNDIAT